LNIARLLGIVLQYLADFADGAVDAVVSIEKDVLAPDPLGNFLAGNELTLPLDQNEQDLQRKTLELQHATSVSELKGSRIDLEVVSEPNRFLRTSRA
jgi:hypothetical protein